MKITKTHHKSSQVHILPIQPGHKTKATCPCGPTITMRNGHLIVSHRPGRGFRGFWRPDVANYGVKLLNNNGKPL